MTDRRLERAGAVTAPVARGPRGRLRSQASWALADQVLSSATNAGLSIVVARSVGASEFGAFSIAFLVFSFLVGLCRASVTDPLIVRFSGVDAAALSDAGRRAAGASLVVGVVGGLLSAAAATVVGESLRLALLALAVVLPGLLVQDAWRQMFFAAGRPKAAAVNDSVWAVSQAVLLGAVLVLDEATILPLTLAWGGAAGIAAVVGAVQAGGAPRPRSALGWLREHRDLNGELAVAYSVNMGAVHLTMTLVGVIGGLAAVGALRAAQVLLGPLQVLFPGLRSFALPVLSRRVALGRPALLRPAVALSAVAGSAAVAWIALLLLVPDRWGEALLGDSWSLAREVLPAVGATTVLVGAAFGAMLLLRAMSRGGSLLRANLVQAPLILVLGCAGAYVDGARGAALGLAAAHLAGFALVWLAVARAWAGPSRG